MMKDKRIDEKMVGHAASHAQLRGGAKWVRTPNLALNPAAPFFYYFLLLPGHRMFLGGCGSTVFSRNVWGHIEISGQKPIYGNRVIFEKNQMFFKKPEQFFFFP
jgi:hypothetical protein